MSVRLTSDAATLVCATLEGGLPLSRDGFNEACRRNPLLGYGVDNKSVQIATRALERVGRKALIELAHADINYRHEDFEEDTDDGERN